MNLKPCPFCGGEATAEFGIVIDKVITDWNVIYCENPKCRIRPTTDWHKTKAVVVREWNRRATNE